MFNSLGFASSTVLEEQPAESTECSCSGVVSVSIRLIVNTDIGLEV